MITRIIELGDDAQQAVEASRSLMDRTWEMESSDLWLESRIGDPVARELAGRGQPIKIVDAWSGGMAMRKPFTFTPTAALSREAWTRAEMAP